jgi:hypothetical protein
MSAIPAHMPVVVVVVHRHGPPTYLAGRAGAEAADIRSRAADLACDPGVESVEIRPYTTLSVKNLADAAYIDWSDPYEPG